MTDVGTPSSVDEPPTIPLFTGKAKSKVKCDRRGTCFWDSQACAPKCEQCETDDKSNVEEVSKASSTHQIQGYGRFSKHLCTFFASLATVLLSHTHQTHCTLHKVVRSCILACCLWFCFRVSFLAFSSSFSSQFSAILILR